jgi:hypothetical protein
VLEVNRSKRSDDLTTDHRRVDTESVQEVLLDDPGFLREIVERVLQEMLEAEMTQHIGAAPYERTERRTGQRNGTSQGCYAPGSAPSICWCLRIGKGRSPRGSSAATNETIRR